MLDGILIFITKSKMVDVKKSNVAFSPVNYEKLARYTEANGLKETNADKVNI